ncbi:MAG: glutaredoxin 3 [Thiohalobacteraceae bacterium]|nr:glutaredoxin 3 [Gammaproteobacteria bacterium]
MSDVIMYCTAFCPYCVRARMLLEHKGVPFVEVRVDLEPDRRGEMEARSGRTSVPQIFIGDFHVGGCDDMFALERAGRLDPLLVPVD